MVHLIAMITQTSQILVAKSIALQITSNVTTRNACLRLTFAMVRTIVVMEAMKDINTLVVDHLSSVLQDNGLVQA